jgi:3-oxoacyl-[acyl-carrier-protein] synthase-3
MNGREIFNFTLDAVPKLIEDVLSKQGWNIEDVDLVLMHQANAFMLKHLVQKLGIPETKAPILMTYCGNTVSSTIPILIDQLRQAGRISSGIRTLVLGFGVGYSWSGCTHIF